MRVLGFVEVDEDAGVIEVELAAQVRWRQGGRLDADSRLMLVGMERLFRAGLVAAAELRSAHYLMGWRESSLDSYRTFRDCYDRGIRAPLSFAHALSSMPLACASLHFGLRGPTYTLMGDAGVWKTTLECAAGALELNPLRPVVAGCAVRYGSGAGGLERDGRHRLVLALLRGGEEHDVRLQDWESRRNPPGHDCVQMFREVIAPGDHPGGGTP
jgi:hypothetical protein